MTRKEFVNRSWKAYQSVIVNDAGIRIECLIHSIDFTNETMELQPLDLSNYHGDVHTFHISKIHPVMKVSVKIKKQQ